jgi:hypothetical protein
MSKYFIILIIIFNLNFINSNFICSESICYFGHFENNNNYYILDICIKTDKEYRQKLYVSSSLIELFIQYDSFVKIKKNEYIQECIQINPNNKTKIYLINEDYIIVGNIKTHIKPSSIIFAPLNFDILSLENYYNITYYIQTTTKSIDNIINQSSNEEEVNYKRGALLNNNNNIFSIQIVLCESNQNKCINYNRYSINSLYLYEDEQLEISKRSIFRRSHKSNKLSHKSNKISHNKFKKVLNLKNTLIGSSLLGLLGISVYISNKSKSFSQNDWCNKNTIISCDILIILILFLILLLIFIYIIKFYSICKKK